MIQAPNPQHTTFCSIFIIEGMYVQTLGTLWLKIENKTNRMSVFRWNITKQANTKAYEVSKFWMFTLRSWLLMIIFLLGGYCGAEKCQVRTSRGVCYEIKRLLIENFDSINDFLGVLMVSSSSVYIVCPKFGQ